MEASSSTTRVFIYGTLKSGFPNHAYNHGQRLPGEFVTADSYPLFLVGQRYSPWLIDLPGEGSGVIGELYELDEQALAQMDRLERVAKPSGYQRNIIEVIEPMNGYRYSAFVYMKTAAQLAEAEQVAGPLTCYEQCHAERYRRREG
jgi:gamma-glutamylaminecyclotransferase